MADEQWTGDDWQKHVNKLCRVQCKLVSEDYEAIPANVHGDGGLEGTTTSGHGYQCYADQDTLSVAALTRKQKAKIRDDLAKLETRRAFWEPYFDDRKLKRWFLVCPKVMDKSVLSYAKQQAKLLREKKLPYIDDAFEAFVVEEDHFEMALQWIKKNGDAVVEIYPDNPTGGDIKAFEQAEPRFVANIDRKLSKVSPSAEKKTITARRKQYLLNHLQSENMLSKLNEESPDIRESFDNFIAAREESVRFQSELDDTKPDTRLIGVHKNLVDDLAHDFKGLSRGTVSLLALGTIVSWLGECPLDFREKGK